MEEILASIRKIIEDNDSGRPMAGDLQTRGDMESFSGSEAADPFGGMGEADERPLAIHPDNINRGPEFDGSSIAWPPDAPREEPLRPDLPRLPVSEGRRQEPRVAPAPVPAGAGEPDHGRAGPQATERDRGEPARIERMRRPAGLQGTADPTPVRAVAEAGPQPFELRPSLQERRTPEAASRHLADHPASASVSLAAGLPAAPASPATPAPATPVSAPVHEGASRSAAAQLAASVSSSRLVSPATVSKVSAAFDDLNHAVEVETRKTFDEIAEEILRPMLQEWLDDNLPRLVERLVREEIQRVARGIRS